MKSSFPQTDSFSKGKWNMQPDREGTHTSSDKVSIYRTGFSYSTAELWNICMLQVAKGSMFSFLHLIISCVLLWATIMEIVGVFTAYCIVCTFASTLKVILVFWTHFVIQSALHMRKCILCIHTKVNISRICTHILICHYSVCICSIATFQCSVLLTCLHPFLYI